MRHAGLLFGLALVGTCAGCATAPLPSQLGPERWRSLGGVRNAEHLPSDRAACLRAAEIEIARPGLDDTRDSPGVETTVIRDEHRFEACMNARSWHRVESPGEPLR